MGMHANATVRVVPISVAYVTGIRRGRRALAGFLAGLLVIGSLAFVAGNGFFGDFRFAAPAPDSPGDNAPADAGRDPLLWPFTRDSIWNLPIGADAVYVHAEIEQSTAYGMTTDVDVLILTPDAPMTDVYYNDDAWNEVPGRCDIEGSVLFSAPIPSDFVVPGNGEPGNPHGVTPNYATAILASDGVTLYQGQPFARCSVDGPATIWWYQTKERIDGRGNSGAHGGSMLSSIGGTIRLGELVPGGVIRHSMKLNMHSVNFYGGLGGYRWPATTKDSCAPGCYTGSNPAVRMGSLLALKPDFDFNQLETEPAKILARAFIDYGAYIADNAGWSVYGIDTEYSPSGDVMVEFENAWGFTIAPSSKTVPWARDMDDIFLNLHVVDNWDADVYDTVAASNGTEGVGGGEPRVPWAPEFGEAPPPPDPDPDQIPPTTVATIDGTAGSADWYRSPVTVTLTATDSGSGVESIHVQVDGGGWSLYQSPVTISSEGRHTVEYYARDVAGNEGAVQSLALGIDTLPPTTAPTVSGTLGGDGWYRSSVTVTLTSADSGSGVAGLRVRTDGSAWVSYTSPLTVAGDGPHVLEYQASDVAGNEEAIASTSFQIDTQAPITTYALSGTLSASGWYHSLVSVTLSATAGNGNPASVSYRLDNGPWTAYSGPFSVDEGRHVLQYQATDSQGTAEPVQSVPIGIDYTPPTIGQAASGTIRPEDDLTWIGFDSVSGIVRYEISVDGGAFLSLGSEARLAGPWTVGTHTAEVRAYDAAGNMATHSIDFEADPNAAAPNQPAVPTIPFNLPPTSTLLVVITLLFVAAGALLYRSARKDRASSRVRERRRRAMAPERWQPDWSDESLDETESFL